MLGSSEANAAVAQVLPELIATEDHLDEVLSRPSPRLIKSIKTLPSPLVILGAGGKMGPSLAILAKRAADAAGHPLEIVAVSRFGESKNRERLEQKSIKTISCDLLNDKSLGGLPEAENVVYLVGLKFGTRVNPAATWAINTLVPARVSEKYAKARIVALSTGNVYPLSHHARGGSREQDGVTPLGEYANAAVGRERIFEYCSQRESVRVALLRLFYAVELRYGVLVDIALKINAGQPVELTNGYLNCIWQGDANETILRALSLATSPPSVWNLCRPEIFPVRKLACRLGELMEVEPRFSGVESENALLGNADAIWAQVGSPAIGLEPMLRWTAHWVKTGGRILGRPTHFEVRDGNY